MHERQPEPRDTDTVAAARALACATVARQWPELAGVEPIVTQRRQVVPARTAQSDEYTFTFSADLRTPEGFTMPRVARVTVDGQRCRVVKAVASK